MQGSFHGDFLERRDSTGLPSWTARARRKMHSPVRDFGPETQVCSGRAKRRGSSAAWRMPMRRVTRTFFTPAPSSRTWSGDAGSSKSRPLCAARVRAIAWQSRPGPQVNSAGEAPESKPRFRVICSSPATGSSARRRMPPPWPGFSHEKFMQ